MYEGSSLCAAVQVREFFVKLGCSSATAHFTNNFTKVFQHKRADFIFPRGSSNNHFTSKLYSNLNHRITKKNCLEIFFNQVERFFRKYFLFVKLVAKEGNLLT